MASSGKDPDEGKVPSSSATATTDEVDSGWGGGAPPEGSSRSESASDESAKTAEEPTQSEAAKPDEVLPTESPPVEKAPVETAPAEPPPAEPPPAEPPRVESPPAEPPVEPPRVESPPPAEPPRVESPPAVASVAASVEVHEEPGAAAAFWGARPSGAWLAAGGGAIVVAFVVGILTGRGSRPEPEVETPAPSSRAPAPPAVAAPAPAPAPSPRAEAEEAPSASPNANANASASPSPGVPKHAAPGFNAKAAKVAIDKIVPGLKSCKQSGEPPGSATVTVTFAPTGRVSDARVTTTRYAGTRTGTCITQRLRQARIPEFVGSPQTVKRSVAIR